MIKMNTYCRILVPTDDVGAIIGRGGQTIRGITTDCKVRIDVHRKDTTGMLEKVILIFVSTNVFDLISELQNGVPDGTTNKCSDIPMSVGA